MLQTLSDTSFLYFVLRRFVFLNGSFWNIFLLCKKVSEKPYTEKKHKKVVKIRFFPKIIFYLLFSGMELKWTQVTQPLVVIQATLTLFWLPQRTTMQSSVANPRMNSAPNPLLQRLFCLYNVSILFQGPCWGLKPWVLIVLSPSRKRKKGPR